MCLYRRTCGDSDLNARSGIGISPLQTIWEFGHDLFWPIGVRPYVYREILKKAVCPIWGFPWRQRVGFGWEMQHCSRPNSKTWRKMKSMYETFEKSEKTIAVFQKILDKKVKIYELMKSSLSTSQQLKTCRPDFVPSGSVGFKNLHKKLQQFQRMQQHTNEENWSERNR